MEIKKELIKKYLEFEGFDYFTASVENYYQTGKPSGSLMIALCKMMEEYHESELKKMRVTDVSVSVCNHPSPYRLAKSDVNYECTLCGKFI
jgi:hypothetical protein